MRQMGLTGGVAKAPPAPSQGQARPAVEPRSEGALAFVNAHVRPMGWPRDGRPGWEHRAEAVLCDGGRVALVGTSETVRAEATRRGIPVEDLQGRLVLPGFVDAHTHFLHVGVKRTRPDLRGAGSLREALARLLDFLRRHPGSHHVIGEGWDESEWTPAPGEGAGTGPGAGPEAGPAPRSRPTDTPGGARRPTRQDLDDVVAQAAREGHGPIDRPVVLRRICGHIAVASSGALPLVRARWDDDAAVDLRTGLLTEAPSLYLNEALPSSPQELDRAVAKACQVAHRLGVTTVGDYSQAPYRAALQRAAARGTLSVRVASSIYVQQLEREVEMGFRTGRPGLSPGDLDPAMRQALSGDSGHLGPVPGLHGGDVGAGGSSAWLRDGGLKVFLDGSLGGHTAHLREPYQDLPEAGGADGHAGHEHGGQTGGQPGPNGSRIWTDADVDRFFGTAHAHGIQVHAHAIGDAAIDQGLEGFARLAARESLEGRGWPTEDLPRRPLGMEAEASEPQGAAKEGLAGPSAAGVGAPSIRHRFEHYEIVHDDQVARTRELGLVASSQPNFVGEWSAKGGMYHTRLGERYLLNNRFRAFVEAGVPLAFGSDGMPFGPLAGLQSAVTHPDPGQRLSPAEAVWHYTTAAAWALHWEDLVGQLSPGAHADLLVFRQKGFDGAPQGWVLERTYGAGILRSTGHEAVPFL